MNYLITLALVVIDLVCQSQFCHKEEGTFCGTFLRRFMEREARVYELCVKIIYYIVFLQSFLNLKIIHLSEELCVI